MTLAEFLADAQRFLPTVKKLLDAVDPLIPIPVVKLVDEGLSAAIGIAEDALNNSATGLPAALAKLQATAADSVPAIQVVLDAIAAADANAREQLAKDNPPDAPSDTVVKAPDFGTV